MIEFNTHESVIFFLPIYLMKDHIKLIHRIEGSGQGLWDMHTGSVKLPVPYTRIVMDNLMGTSHGVTNQQSGQFIGEGGRPFLVGLRAARRGPENEEYIQTTEGLAI